MNASIDVTDSLDEWAAALKRPGITHAYRVRVGAEEIIGATNSETAAWREARRVKKQMLVTHKGRLVVPLRTWWGGGRKVVAE